MSKNMKELDIRNDKKKWIGLILIGLLVVLFVIEILIERANSYSVQFFRNQILLWALWNICFILILILLYLHVRYLRNLYIEKKRKILGYKFKVKLVISFLGLALIPSILLVIAGVNLINRVIEGWFKTPVGDVLSKANDISDRYYNTLKRQANNVARSMAERIEIKGLWIKKYRKFLQNYLEEKMKDNDFETVEIKIKDDIIYLTKNPKENYPKITEEAKQTILSDKTYLETLSYKDGDYIRAMAPLHDNSNSIIGYISVATYVDPGISKKAWLAKASFNKYKELFYLKKPIKRYYFNLFLMITLLILFGVSWIGFNLAKEITVPIQMLAEGTKKISAGDLDYRITFESSDEIGILINSFNKMTEEIKLSKEELEKSNTELKNINLYLEERRRYIETILNTITTGVITIDENDLISTINPSACKILRLPSNIKPGQPYKDFFIKNGLEKFSEVIASYLSKKKIAKELELELNICRRVKHLRICLAPLIDVNNQFKGIIVAIEDLTEMFKVQKVITWQEIARRIAHEINNPLTPIQLSAEHIRKKITEDNGYLKNLLLKDANNIIEGVQTLKTLVNEFSRFARLPAVNKKLIDIHMIIKSAINMYDGILKDISIETNFDTNMPMINGDPEQLKRVMMNLFENSIEAMKGKGKISINTDYDAINSIVRIEVMDDGPGIPVEERDKIFVPYYSTKKKGMGLGLAIVERIITDHGGTIKLDDTVQKGVKFQIELPV